MNKLNLKKLQDAKDVLRSLLDSLCFKYNEATSSSVDCRTMTTADYSIYCQINTALDRIIDVHGHEWMASEAKKQARYNKKHAVELISLAQDE